MSGLEADLGIMVRMVQLVKANVTTEERSLSPDQGLGEKQQARGLEKETTWWKTEWQKDKKKIKATKGKDTSRRNRRPKLPLLKKRTGKLRQEWMRKRRPPIGKSDGVKKEAS